MSSTAPGNRVEDHEAGPPAGGRTATEPLSPPLPAGRSWWTWPAFVAVALLGALLLVLHVRAYYPLSPFDEAQHVDYVHRLVDGGIPAAGDTWLPDTTEAVTCRGIDTVGVPPCGTADLSAAPNEGRTGAYHHTPAYYLVPAGAVLLADAFGLSADAIDVMRTTGVLWLVAALGLLWILWREVGVLRQTRAGLSLALSATPGLLLAQATVTNEATALTAGAAVILATLVWERGRVRLWLPVAVAGLAIALDATNLAAVLAACLFVVVRAGQRSPSARGRWRTVASRRTGLFVGSLAAAAAVVGIGWATIWRSGASVDPYRASTAADTWDPGMLASAASALIPPLQPVFYASPLTASGPVVIVANLVSVGLLLLAVVGAVRSEPGSAVRALAVAVGLAAVTFGPLCAVLQYAATGALFPTPVRYAFPLVPGMLAVAGTAVRTRRGGTALLGVGLLFAVVVAWELLH